jgi:UDP-glucose 4-epimerase
MSKFMQGNSKRILVPGGAGYIGSHTCVELLNRGYTPVIVDNFVNSSMAAIDRICQITGANDVPVIEADIRDTDAMICALREHECEAVIHFAGLKAVGESTVNPLDYYSNNVQGSLSLLDAMKQAGVGHIVFSSSATVYGTPVSLPYTEDHPLAPTNPYGMTKYAVELMLNDLVASGAGINAGILRYFNPIGAHPTGLIGEDPNGVPNNLMPFVAQVAVGRRPHLNVFGNDYDTPDGTGVRDYIHVVDLARAHLDALSHAVGHEGCDVFNIGTGRGATVLELVHMFERVTGREIPYRIAPRRDGDIAEIYANAGLAEKLFGWRAEKTLDEMCADHWRWQSQNPEGYKA